MVVRNGDLKIGIIWYGQCLIGPDYAMSFTDDNSRHYAVDGTPHPVVHAVDVEREKVDVSFDTRRPYDLIDILCRNPGVAESWRVDECIQRVLEEAYPRFNIAFVPVKEMAPPTVIEDQIGRHAFDAVAGANLNGSLVCSSNYCKQKQQYSVFFELRVAAKSDLSKIGQGRNLAQGHVFVG